MSRLDDLCRFYNLLDTLEHILGGRRVLSECNSHMDWPQRGVYFFFESGENRTHSGQGPRVVRVGTHALITGNKSTLWKRLRHHRGSLTNGGGNHRGSIFRLHVGTALLNRDHWPWTASKCWNQDDNIDKAIRTAEFPLEQAISQYIRLMPFLWLAVDDAPSPDSLRGTIERNSIALLSNFNTPENPLDPPSPTWLGNWADRVFVKRSGLWNVQHIDEIYNPVFLDTLEDLINNVNKQ